MSSSDGAIVNRGHNGGLGGRAEILAGPVKDISTAQKRQSLKEALPVDSSSGTAMFRLFRSVQLGIKSCCLCIEALPFFLDLAGRIFVGYAAVQVVADDRNR